MFSIDCEYVTLWVDVSPMYMKLDNPNSLLDICFSCPQRRPFKFQIVPCHLCIRGWIYNHLVKCFWCLRNILYIDTSGWLLTNKKQTTNVLAPWLEVSW